MSSISTKTKEKPRPDRLGRAVVSFIFSLFGFFLFILTFKAFDDNAYLYSNGPLIFFVIVLIVNLISFILGINARRSSSGRGLAIAAITISSIPLVFQLFLIVGAFLLLYL